MKSTNKLFNTHYLDAIKIANSYKSFFMQVDDREAVALQALWRAVQRFDPQRSKAKFNTVLYEYVTNGIRDEEKKLRRIPTKNSTQVPAHLCDHCRKPMNLYLYSEDILKRRTKAGVFKYYCSKTCFSKKKSLTKHSKSDTVILTHAVPICESELDIFETLNISDRSRTVENLEYREFLFLVKKKLTKKQNKILRIALNTKWYADRYTWFDMDSAPTNITGAMVSKILHCTRQRVDQELRAMRRIFQQVLVQQESSFCKLTKEDQGALYG